MAKTIGAVRESYTLKNGSKALLKCQNKIMKFKDMMCLCNFGTTEII